MLRTFNIRLWFAVAGFGILAVIWIACAWWFTDFMTTNLLERESEVSQEFLQSIVDVEGAELFDSESTSATPNRPLVEFSRHVSTTPGIMRANIYSANRKIVWSTDPRLIGQSFPDNDELIEALKGKRITEINSIESHKSEYVGFGERGLFIEAYLPIRSNDAAKRVVGVVELYKFPTALNVSIAAGKRVVWLSGLGAALLAYFTLYWIVQRGARVIETQQRQLADMQSSALVGELASAVAHSLRNPMAAIRSSAELWRADPSHTDPAIADDVIHEIDRMNEYVRDLLDYAHSDRSRARPLDPSLALDTVLKRREAALRRNAIAVHKHDQRETASEVNVDPVMFEHALTSIVNNAIEAMPRGGRLDLTISPDESGRRVVIEIADTGPGIPQELINHVTESYFTTKSKGLGLGLSLARNVIERWGGVIDIQSSRENGTTVAISLKKA